MASSYRDWNFTKGLVDTQAMTDISGKTGGNFVSSESILIAAGPAKFTDLLNDIYPIGVIQNFNLAQNKTIQQLFEIGSRETILVPGRTFIQAAIARVMFDGPSLMKAVYSLKTAKTAASTPGAQDNTIATVGDIGDAGNGDLFLSLSADLFNVPIGLALLIHDSSNEIYGGAYLENTLIASHNLTLSAGQTVVAENVSARVGGVKPIKFSLK